MDAVADYLGAAASDILFLGLNWPESEQLSVDTAVDVHVESARLWVDSVTERLEVWTKRARQIANALDRPARLN